MGGPIPLILDVDTGVDDALALLYAVASPEVDLIGATCVMGNVTVDRAVENTLAVLEVAGAAGVEVARGAEAPLSRAHEPFPMVHGERGLGHGELPVPSTPVSTRSAPDLIVETARGRPGEVLLVATGPLTNLAQAVEREPELPTLLRGFALMGGAYGRGGNTTPVAEANVWVDPEAARIVFTAFADASFEHLPLAVGLDVTDRVKLTRGHLDAICRPAPGSRLARFLQGAVRYYIEFYEGAGAADGASMHDPLALAIAIDPKLATLVATRVEVETEGRWTRGMTVADLGRLRDQPWNTDWAPEDNARVALDVNAEEFLWRFVERLRRWVEAQG